MRWTFFVGLFGVVVISAFAALYRWDASTNRGYNLGYYGDYNRVSNALVGISGVVVTQSWHNADVSMEEFGFDIVQREHRVRLYFGENDPVRSMSIDQARKTLKRYIDAELAKDGYLPPNQLSRANSLAQ